MRKFNKDPNRAYLIKKLLNAGTSTAEIMKIANCSKQLVSKYIKYDPKPRPIKRSLKLPEKYSKLLINIAQDKPCGRYSSRYLAGTINKYLRIHKVKDSKGRIMTVTHSTINSYLNRVLGKPKKIRKVFYLSETQKKERVKFCEMILKKYKKGNIFWTDETQIDLCNFTRDYIRLSKENKEKLAKGELDVYELITRPKKNLKSQ